MVTATGRVGGAVGVDYHNVTVLPPYRVAVTPHGGTTATRAANSGPYSETFTVQNTGYYTDTYTITCGNSGPIACTGTSAGTLPLTSGQQQTVTASYTTLGGGQGTITLSATSPNATDVGSYTVNVAVFTGAPVVEMVPYNYRKQDYSLCAASCFAAVYKQSTASYISFDTPHSVTLAYNSDRVNPRPFVHVNVSPDPNYGQAPTEYRLQIKVGGAFVTFVNGEQLLRFTYPGSAKARLGGQFDASSYVTNVYPMDILVTALYATGGPLTNWISTKLVVVNETTSPVAAGWTLAGVQRLYPQVDGSALVTEGDGSAVYVVYAGGAFVSPAGEFSRLIQSTLSGTNGWARIYPDSSKAVFDNTGRLVQLRDRFNDITTVVYDGSGRVWQIKDPANFALTLSYGANGLASVQDPGTPARTTTVNVDASRKLTAITDPDNVSTNFVYDVNSLLWKLIDRRADTTTFGYDALSRKVTSVTYPAVPIFGSGTISPTKTYAPWQRVGVPYTATGVTAANAPLVDTVRARITDPRGFVTVVQVDPFGAVNRTDDALGRTTTFTRDTNAHIIRDSLPSGHVVRRTWSGPNVTQVWDSTASRTINYVYEGTWNQLTQISGDADSVWNYWSFARLDSTVAGTRSTSGSLRRKSTFTFDALGRVLTATDPRGHAVRFYYNPASWQNTDSVKTNISRTGYTYDAYGRVATLKTPANVVTTFQYDSLNRRTKIVGPIADTTISTYDALFLWQVRDAKGQTHQFAYNALGWVASRTDPAGKQDLYAYDQNGNVRQWTNRRNQTVVWDAYDALNRRMRVTDAEGGRTSFAYDPQDRFVVDSNAAAIDTVWYDRVGRASGQVTVRSGTRYVLRSTFTVRNLRDTLQITNPWSATVRYHYAANMVMDTLTDIAGGRTALSYNYDLQPASFTLPTGLVITRDFPSTHTPQQVTFSDATINGAIGARYSYNVLGKIDDRGNADGSGGRDFNYDALERLSYCGDYSWQASGCDWYCGDRGCTWQCLSQQKVYSSTQTFSYDSVGNRKDLGAMVAIGNRLVTFNGDSLVYDVAGNLIKRIRAGLDVQRLYWNSLGQLAAAWTSSRDSVTFAYDGLGRRVSKQKASGTTRYLYDRVDLFAEVDAATGNRLAEYTYYPLVDDPHSVRVGGPTGQVYYYTQDFPGNVTGLISGSNTLSNGYQYGPFGADPAGYPIQPVPNSLKFAGRPQDSETGLYYMRARYYDPGLGRFVSEDPAGLAAGINEYVYTGNDAVNGRDPSGQGCEPAPVYVSRVSSERLASDASADDCGGGAAEDLGTITSGYWFGLDPFSTLGQIFAGRQFQMPEIPEYNTGLADAAIAVANGGPYKYEQKHPPANGAMDCSGYVFESVQRDRSQCRENFSTRSFAGGRLPAGFVPVSDPQPFDIVVMFNTQGNHMGFYLGRAANGGPIALGFGTSGFSISNFWTPGAFYVGPYYTYRFVGP
jgi:RHS repeat-associated protein